MYKLLADLMNMGRIHFLGAPRKLLEASLRSSYFANFGRPAGYIFKGWILRATTIPGEGLPLVFCFQLDSRCAVFD